VSTERNTENVEVHEVAPPKTDEFTSLESETDGSSVAAVDDTNPLAFESDADLDNDEDEEGGDPEVLFTWLSEIDDDETEALFEVLMTIDPLATSSGVFHWRESQRKVLTAAREVYTSAGYEIL
jgi:hypothetical protein